MVVVMCATAKELEHFIEALECSNLYKINLLERLKM